MDKLLEIILQLLQIFYSARDCITAICSVFGFIALLVVAAGSFAGITQALIRFELALFAKKIAIIAGLDDFNDIRKDLVNSGLIKTRNIQHVTNKHLDEAQSALLMIIVHEYLSNEEFNAVVRGKKPQCGLIVYCPPEKGRIDEQGMKLLSMISFTALCNFRGRMVNDVLLMMLSTSFKGKDIN